MDENTLNELLNKKMNALYAKTMDEFERGFLAQYKGTNIQQLFLECAKIKYKYTIKPLESLLKDNCNLSTANGTGLDLWGLILGFSRYVFIELVDDKPFYYTLTDKQFRQMLMIIQQKQFQNGSLRNVNKFVYNILGEYAELKVLDSQNMEYIIYQFQSILPTWLKWTLANTDILPRPAGVGVKLEEIDTTAKKIGFAPDESDKTTDENAYNERVKFFEENRTNLTNAIFATDEQQGE